VLPAHSETPVAPYGRAEPVTSPVVFGLQPFGPGSRRSAWYFRSYLSKPVAPGEAPRFSMPASAERLVVPPEGGESLAEAHGKFDTGRSGGSTPRPMTPCSRRKKDRAQCAAWERRARHRSLPA